MCAFTLSRASRDLSRQGRGAGNTLSPCGAAYAAERKEGCERARGFGRGLLPGACALLLVAGAPNAHAADDVSGWFIGLRGGIAESTLDEGDLERALAARGHNAAVSLDDQEPTWSVFGGYRWAMGLGLEAFAIDLGEYDVAINTASTNPGGLLADARSVLADAGRGAGVALSWRWAITDRFAITPRLGGYYWESERTLTSGAQRIERSENGLNAMGGIALGIQLSSAWSLAFGWDAYDAGGRNDVRAYSATVEYRFGR
jgi:OOP family OmpA-OmpF porin